MNHACPIKSVYRIGHYSLTALRKQDIYLIKTWRNEQIDILRQKEPLSDEDQKKYYEQVVKPSFEEEKPEIVLLSFLLGERCIGYGGLTYVDWNSGRAEVSFILDTSRTGDLESYARDFKAFITLLKQVAFEDLGLNRLYTELYDIRPYFIAFLENNGFKFEGRLKEHNRIGGRFVDSIIHGFLRKDYETEKRRR